MVLIWFFCSRVIPHISCGTETRLSKIMSRIDTAPSSVPCGGYSRMYKCMCDYHGVTYMDDVAWVCIQLAAVIFCLLCVQASHYYMVSKIGTDEI